MCRLFYSQYKFKHCQIKYLNLNLTALPLILFQVMTFPIAFTSLVSSGRNGYLLSGLGAVPPGALSLSMEHKELR